MGKVIPYKGFDDITFHMSFRELRDLLKTRKIKHSIENWSNKGCTPEVPWDIIRIGKDISFFFAKGRMFKIYFEHNFSESLDNGICLGMKIRDAERIDPSIRYDDWEEIYISDKGYWLEDNVDSGEIISLTIFIKELENEEIFFKYEWCDKSK